MQTLVQRQTSVEAQRDAKLEEYEAALAALPAQHPEVCQKVKEAVEKLRALEEKRLDFVKVTFKNSKKL